MGYGINVDDVPSVGDYAAAERVWRDARPWRKLKGDHDPRPLDTGPNGRRKRHMTVRMRSDSAVAFALYDTDLVVYHLDGSLDLTAHPTQSSQRVVDRVGPADISPLWTAPDCGQDGAYWLGIKSSKHANADLWLHTRIYRTGSVVRLRWEADDWSIDPSTPTFTIKSKTINRSRATAARKLTNYREFALWGNAAIKLGALEDAEWRIGSFNMLVNLADKDTWPTLLNSARLRGMPWLLEMLRRDVYAADPSVFDVTEMPFIQGFVEYRKFCGRMNK